MKKYSTLTILFVFILFISCTIEQEIELNIDGSGNASIDIEVMDGFYDYLLTFREDANDLGYESDDSIFNLAAIEDKLSELNGVTISKISSPTDKKLKIEFSFTDIDNIIEGIKGDADLISFIRNGNTGTFTFFLNAQTYYQIIPLVPVTDSPLYEALGPQPEYPISEQEYLDLVEFTIGDEGPEMVKESLVTTEFDVDGDITSQIGGELSRRKVTFEMPLLKFLLLLDTTEYKVTFIAD
jgi:hypothetical protein